MMCLCYSMSCFTSRFRILAKHIYLYLSNRLIDGETRLLVWESCSYENKSHVLKKDANEIAYDHRKQKNTNQEYAEQKTKRIR